MDGIEERYSRQMLFARIGRAGQERIRQATVGLLGLGALGSNIAEMLVRAGVGRIIAVDRDIIEMSNLHRQGLYVEEDARERLPKAIAAGRRLSALNPETVVDCRVVDFGPENARDTFRDCDLLLDGTDGFEARYLLNDLAIDLDRPWIYGACVGSGGMTATIIPGKTPCLACLFPEPPSPGTQETCDTAGIIAPAASIAASLQVTEALKLLVGDMTSLRRSLLSFELWPFRIVELGRDGGAPREDCRACARRDLTWLDGSEPSRTIKLCGRNSVQVYPPRGGGRIDLTALERRLEPLGKTMGNDFAVTFTIGEHVLTIFEDGRALIKGTTDPAVARSLYGRYVGL